MTTAKPKSRKVAWVVLGVVVVLLSALLVLVGPTIAQRTLYEQWVPVHVAAGTPSGKYVWEPLDPNSAIQRSGWSPPPSSPPAFFKVTVPRWEWLPLGTLSVEIEKDEWETLWRSVQGTSK